MYGTTTLCLDPTACTRLADGTINGSSSALNGQRRET